MTAGHSTFQRRGASLVAAVWVALAAAGPAAAGETAAALAAFTAVDWPDQLGGRDRLAAHAGERVVLLVVEARRLALAGRWAEALGARDAGLTVLTVADAPPDVAVDPARFAAMLRKRVPAGVRVWMDPGRELALALGLDTAEPNLLLVAPDGALAASFRGRVSPPLLDAVVAAATALPGTPAGVVP